MKIFLASFFVMVAITVEAQETLLPQKQADNADKRVDRPFDADPLVGLAPSGTDEELEDLEPHDRVKKTRRDVSEAVAAIRHRQIRQLVPPQPIYDPAPDKLPTWDLAYEVADTPIFRDRVEQEDVRIRYVNNKVARNKRNDEEGNDDDNEDKEVNASPVFEYRAYGGGDASTGRSAGPQGKPNGQKKRPRPASPPQPEFAPQIDENFVATLFKHPEAVKFVFDYLEEKNAFTTTTVATTTTTKKTTTTTTPKPTTTATPKKKTTTTKIPGLKSIFTPPPRPQPSQSAQSQINRLNSLFGLALLGGGQQNENGNNNNNNREQPAKKSEIKRVEEKPRIPNLSSLFSALEGARPQRQERPDLERRRHEARPEQLVVDNPLLTGQKKPEFERFGPSDFVPKSKYSLPVHTNGPMRLKYVSAADFPFNTPFGIVPIPR